MTAAGRPTRVRGLVARGFRSPPAAALAAALDRLAAPPPDGFAVLTYHRVDEPDARPWLNPSLLSATPSTFEEQMTALLRHHHPIGLPELIAARRGGPSLPRRSVLVTFDDAYRDFLEHAWPVLGRLGIQATMFVPTAYPDAADRRFWWDRVWQATQRAGSGTIETPIGRRELSDEPSRRATARALVEHLKDLPHDEAMAAVDALTNRLGEGPVRAAPEARGRSGGRRGAAARASDVLGWDELRRMAVAGLHVAPHSRTHPVMTQLSPEQVEAELRGAREDLGRHLGDLAVETVFAYPAGRHSPATRNALARLGFELAFTTDRGINQVSGSDPLALRRINVGLRSGPELVRAQLAFFTLRYRARGV